MQLFWQKMKNRKSCSCSCSNFDSHALQRGSGNIKVLGPGCKSCHILYDNAVKAAGKDCVEYITDVETLAATGIMSFPALIINDEVVSTGKVLTAEEISDML